MARSFALLVVALFLSAGAALAHGDRHVHYVGGLGAPSLSFQGPCVSTPFPEVDIGGACVIQVGTGLLDIEVEDALVGAIGYSYVVADQSGSVCARGVGAGITTLTIVMPCRYVTVVPDAGATTGDIVFESR